MQHDHLTVPQKWGRSAGDGTLVHGWDHYHDDVGIPNGLADLAGDDGDAGLTLHGTREGDPMGPLEGIPLVLFHVPEPHGKPEQGEMGCEALPAVPRPDDCELWFQ